jgi:inosine-uridine nucleoside N-ribohydrolase
MRLWIDTDVGDDPDDAIALRCAARSAHTEIVGVSTVSGDVEKRAELARALVPGVLVVAGPPPPELVAGVDGLLAIGPWTHVADLAAKDALPRRVVLMGGLLGEIRHHGTVLRIEHNVGSDPAAAAQLLSSTGNLIVVPLDATARVRASEGDERCYIEMIPGFAAQLAAWREEDQERRLILHDPAALLILLGEQVSRMEARRLSVDPDGTMRASVDGPLQHVVAHVDSRATRSRVRALVQEGD